MLTKTKLNQLLKYDEVTRCFIWKQDVGSSKKGDVAGTKRGRKWLIQIDNKLYSNEELLEIMNEKPKYLNIGLLLVSVLFVTVMLSIVWHKQPTVIETVKEVPVYIENNVPLDDLRAMQYELIEIIGEHNRMLELINVRLKDNGFLIESKKYDDLFGGDSYE